MKYALLAAAWLSTLAVVFVVGRSTSPEPEPQDSPPPRREAPVPEPGTPTAMPDDDFGPDVPRPHPQPAPSALEPGGDPEAPSRAGGPPDPATPLEEPKLSLPAEITSLREVSKALQAYVVAQFELGDEGAVNIVKALDTAIKQLQKTRIDDRQAVRELYPWLKFLVQHESETVDFLESLLRVIGEDPAAFEGIDNNTIEIFLEGFPTILPGVISEERLDGFRALAQKILALPQDQLPDSIKKNVRRLERAITFAWAEPIDAEGLAEALRGGTLQPGQLRLALRQVDLMKLSQVDRTALLETALREGNWEAIRAIERMPPGSVDAGALDGAVLDALKAGQSPYILLNYCQATGRKTWSEMRPLVDVTLSAKPDSADNVGWLISSLRDDMRPDTAWVRDFLVRYELSENVRDRVKKTYEIR